MKDTSAAWARAASSTLHIASGSAKPDRKVCPNRVQKGGEKLASALDVSIAEIFRGVG